MNKLFFVVDTYGAPTQPYIPALINKLSEKIVVGGVFSVTKPVVENKEVVFLKGRPSFKSLLWALGYYVKNLDFYKNYGSRFFLIKCIANLYPVLKEGNGIIHVIHSQKAPLMMKLCDPLKYDFVVHFRGYDTNVRPFNDPDWRTGLMEIYNKAKALVFLSNQLADVAINELEAPFEKCYVSAPGVDAFIYDNGKKGDQIIRFATIGRMVWEKGYYFVLLAVKKLLALNKNFEYHIIGGGDDIKQISYLIKMFNLEEYVFLHGFIINNDAKTIVSNCDVYMQCSVSESSSVSLKEAGMMSLPLIGTNVGGIPETVVDGVTGTLVEIGDIDGLAFAMHKYIMDPGLRRQHGENARKLCIEKYSIDAESDRLINVYNSIYGNA